MLNEKNKGERQQPSSDAEVERGFGDRLRRAIGDRSILSFAKECGISDSLVRKYLAGSLPGLDKAVAMARVGGVSLSWLATGEGSPDQTPSAATGLGRPDIDLDALEDVMAQVLALLEKRRPDLSVKARARIVRLVYEFYIKQEKPMDEASLNNIIELAAFR